MDLEGRMWPTGEQAEEFQEGEASETICQGSQGPETGGKGQVVPIRGL